MYLNGNGATQDYKVALKWLQLSADQNNTDAQVKVGSMYYFGRGLPQDYVRAHMWFNLAAASGSADGAKFRDGLSKMMTPGQIAEAQRLAGKWKPVGHHAN
jgi:TPR repeat protein